MILKNKIIYFFIFYKLIIYKYINININISNMQNNGLSECHSICIKKPEKIFSKLFELFEYINNPESILDFLSININKINVFLYINNHNKLQKPYYLFYESIEQMMELNEYTLNLTDYKHMHAYYIKYNNEDILESELFLVKNEKFKAKNIINLNNIKINYDIFNKK